MFSSFFHCNKSSELIAQWSVMSSPSLSIICYKNGFSYVSIPVKLKEVKDKEENKVRILIIDIFHFLVPF